MNLSRTGGTHAPRTAQCGFALVAGVFLIAVLSLLSAYLVSLRSYQDSGISLDTLGTRAYAASRAGAEWAAYNSLRNNACAATTGLVLGGTLAGFTATVACSRSMHDEAGTAVAVDTIVATACNQPSAGVCPNPAPGALYVERQVMMVVGR